MAFKNTLPTSILSAILLLAIASTVSLIETAFASTDNTTEIGTTGETPQASSDASKMMGEIASIQLDENGNPSWITSGHWNIESELPLIGTSGGNETDPQVSNFNATLYMVSNADGTATHRHEISNFTQTGVLHEGPNATTVNGTFTITLQEGPINDVSGYIHVINDKIEFWVDPVASENHFGPTTITGIVLSPERFGDMTADE